MRIVACKVGAKAQLIDIYHHLHEFKKFVGGHIETVTSPIGFAIVCNEEGLLKELPENPTVDDVTAMLWRWPTSVRGDYFICGISSDDLTDVQDDALTRDLIDILNERR